MTGTAIAPAPSAEPLTGRSSGQRSGRRVWSYWRFYLALSPFYVLFAVFGLYPMLSTIVLAFQRWDGLSPRRFTGLDNFRFLFEDPTFWLSLQNTVVLFFMSTIPTLCIALVLAVMLQSAVRFTGVYRIAYFIPNVTSLVAMAIFFSAVFSTNFGLINAGLRSLGIPEQDWLGQPWGIKIAVSTMIVWQWVGYNTLIYLAGLQSIPKDQYEAAKVDGAGPVRTFFSITLPQMRSIVLFTVIISTIGGLQTFTEPQVMVGNSGGTGQSGMTVVLYFYRAAFLDNDYGYAAAIALSIFMLVLLFTAINWRIFRVRGDAK
ncbi:cellobiose transport system permease protein [Kribbella sp. VKM Ac-2527]|uniref:Cellobiose transport system permease protein n=1 Tax=Kribbella caucasensis TaxID=2512215 RepID=A0A4V3CB40_9ACTN|nr:sugar ABC transporter permease [Kribbella sp. VKM Ac-2527]TDO52792.1 cellobiose transport system permease protein [Kribbella sp. VKM Ac-2527]